jgi:hypothetical protein
VIAADAFDGQDLPAVEQRARRVDVVELREISGGQHAPVGARQTRAGTTGVAGVGLSVKTATARVVILAPASLAELKAGHARLRAIVG